MLLFVIARSMKPCELSIGGIFVASNEIFATDENRGQQTLVRMTLKTISIKYNTPHLPAENVKYFAMSLECQFYYEQHFLLSNRIVQLVLGLHPSQCPSDQLFQCCTLAIYVLPMIAHQFYQLVVSDIKLQSTCNLLQKLLGSLCITCTYSILYFRFSTLQNLCAYLKRDYKQFVDKEEINIYNKYTKRNKFYVIILCNSCILYGMSLTIPSIVNLFLHIFGLIDNVQLTLPFPVNNVLKAGLLYYFLLIYEIIGIFVVLLVACSCYSSYLIIVQHACIQFSILIFKIHQPFDERNFTHKAFYGEINQKEHDWIIDIIARYTRITKLI
ncbi:hypothetical protein HZH68_012585 [Vespula germanica]|uniref:Odorant receptor n=1 Tax=Vespula germanica TaxID=30212 RepID=A0A834JHU9_VESGE|nr:hypothetical protein HZH68_012585 [Vespula germanica]